MNTYIYDYIFNYGVKIVGWENGSICLKYDNGHRYWWLNGKLHRTNGPAIEYTDGDKYWYLNDLLHRTNGPAVELTNGTKSWWLNGKQQK